MGAAPMQLQLEPATGAGATAVDAAGVAASADADAGGCFGLGVVGGTTSVLGRFSRGHAVQCGAGLAVGTGARANGPCSGAGVGVAGGTGVRVLTAGHVVSAGTGGAPLEGATAASEACTSLGEVGHLNKIRFHRAPMFLELI